MITISFLVGSPVHENEVQEVIFTRTEFLFSSNCVNSSLTSIRLWTLKPTRKELSKHPLNIDEFDLVYFLFSIFTTEE